MKIQPVKTDIHQNDATQTTMPPKKGELTGHSVSWNKVFGYTALFGLAAAGVAISTHYLFQPPKDNHSLGHRMLECVGKPDQACQELLKNEFVNLFKEDFRAAYIVAEKCLNVKDETCQSVAKNALPLLLENKVYDKASLFADSCIEKQHQECLYKIAENAQFLLENKVIDNRFVRRLCVDKEDIACSALRQSTFTLFQNNKNDSGLNMLEMRLLAEQCMGKKSSGCRDILDKAITLLSERPAELATFGANCVEKENEIARKILSQFLSTGHRISALVIAYRCLEKNDAPCLSFLKIYHPELLKLPN